MLDSTQQGIAVAQGPCEKAHEARVYVAEEVAAREASPQENWAALQEAWKPFRVAWKALWWEAASTPEDMTAEAFSEGKPVHSLHTPRETVFCLWPHNRLVSDHHVAKPLMTTSSMVQSILLSFSLCGVRGPTKQGVMQICVDTRVFHE